MNTQPSPGATAFCVTIELGGKTATGSTVATMRGRFMLSVGDAKTIQTRRIAKAVETLPEGR